jgi:putative copper export protein
MNAYPLVLTLHVVAATIWTGGHIVLATVVLPRVLRHGAVGDLQRFEAGFERIGIPALLVQVASGFWLAHRIVPDISIWLDVANPVARLILVKVGLLVLTIAFAIDARLRIIPNLSEKNLAPLAWHIIPVTVISVAFVVVGVAFRTGWLY